MIEAGGGDGGCCCWRPSPQGRRLGWQGTQGRAWCGCCYCPPLPRAVEAAGAVAAVRACLALPRQQHALRDASMMLRPSHADLLPAGEFEAGRLALPSPRPACCSRSSPSWLGAPTTPTSLPPRAPSPGSSRWSGLPGVPRPPSLPTPSSRCWGEAAAGPAPSPSAMDPAAATPPSWMGAAAAAPTVAPTRALHPWWRSPAQVRQPAVAGQGGGCAGAGGHPALHSAVLGGAGACAARWQVGPGRREWGAGGWSVCGGWW